MVNLLGNFMAVDFKTRYFTLICTIGQVLTNMNNPLREEYEDYRDIPAKKVPSRFLKAEDCANFMIKNFSKFFMIFKAIPNCREDIQIMRE